MAAKDILRRVKLVFDKASGKQVEDEAKKSLNVVEQGFAKLKKVALGIGATLAVAFGVRAMIRFGKESVRVAAESEAIWTRLGHAVENVGMSFKDARPEIVAFARAMQDATTVGDEDFATILTELITFSGDYERSLRNVGVVADLAAAKQLDLRTAAQLVGKAMIGETSTLKRYGVIVAEGADGVEAMRKQFRGFATSEASTFAGWIKRLSNEWSDFKQAVGEGLIAVSGGTSIMERLTEVVKNMTIWVDSNKLTFQRWGEAFVEVLDRVGAALQRKLDQLDPLGKKERDRMKEILALTGNQLALDGKRFQLGQEILALEEKRREEAVKLAGLEAPSLVNTTILARQSRYRLAQIEEEIQSLQGLIREIDNVGTAAEGVKPLSVMPPLGGGGGDPEEKPNLGALTFSMGIPPLGELKDAKELQAIWEQYPALMAQVNGELSRAEQIKEGWAGLNSEMEMSASNAANLAAQVVGIGDAAELSQGELALMAAAADAAGSIVAGMFGAGVGKMAKWKAEQNAIMAAEETAMGLVALLNPLTAATAPLHFAAAGKFAAIAGAWATLAGATGGFSGGGGGGGGSGGPRDVGGAASERAEPPGPEVHIYMEGHFDALNPTVQRVVAGAIRYSGETYGPNAQVTLHRRKGGR